jgi:rhodanese-related sulfurtransferase
MLTYVLLGLAALAGFVYYSKQNESKMYNDVFVKELPQLLKDKNTRLIDVRTVNEIKEGVIGKPLLIELGMQMQQELSKLDKNKKYIVYCRSGRRSIMASKMMLKMGFKDVNNLLGGYNAWMSSR